LAVGGGFEQAYLRMELVEHQAKIALNATTLGAVRQLPPEEVEALSKKGRPASFPIRENAGESQDVHPASSGSVNRAPNVGVLVDKALKRFS